MAIMIVLNSFQAFSQQNIYQKIQQQSIEIEKQSTIEIAQKVNDVILDNKISKTVLNEKHFYQIDKTILNDIKANKQSVLKIKLPVNAIEKEFHLTKADLFTPDFTAVTNGKDLIEIDKGVHYWGIAKNEENSLVALSVFNNEIVASIYTNGENYIISKMTDSDIHMGYNNRDFNQEFNFACAALPVEKDRFTPLNNTQNYNPNDCVRLHIEADYSLYQSNGSSVNNTTNYINGVFNQVAIMFANESINIAISYLNVWSSPSPYASGNELSGLDAQNYGRQFGDLVHLLHTNGGGGVAWLDVLCLNSQNTAVSGVFNFFNNVPTYSWDVNVITHELGHNLGSPHTHACAWNGNNTAIDGCGDQAGYSEGCTGPIPGSGTVMSYCHLIGGVGVDLGLGFGTQPGNLIRNRVANANCLTACGPPTCSDGFQNGDETGVDCGGTNCPACPTCFDNLQNGDETGVDCGGPDCSPCPCVGGSGFSLIIDPDFYISETTWDFTDSNGNVVASGGGNYANGQGLTVEAICLPAGCYDFTIYDSYGDGLFDGNTTGTYTIIDETGATVVSGVGNFGSSETSNFCVTATCANVDLNIFFDNFPGQTSWDITDASNSIVASGGTYGSQPGNNTIDLAAVACLADGCYTLNFYDAIGNGMCPFRSSANSSGIFVTPGTLITPGSIIGGLSVVVTPGLCGNYTLTDANGNVLANGGGDFGSQESTNFCLSGGLAPRLANPNKDKFNAIVNTESLNIQPNPVQNQLNVLGDISIDEYSQYQIVNILGEIVLENRLSDRQFNQVNINVEAIEAGTYFFIMKDANQIHIEKFVKQ